MEAMMRQTILVLLIGFGLWATAQQSTAPPAAAPNQPVITVHGACTPQKNAATACETVITREQFEKLIQAINTNNEPIPQDKRRSLAQSYVELLAYSQAATKAGTENDPKFAELMQLVRLRTLSDVYSRNLEEQFRHPDAQEIQAYYSQNLSKFDEIKLARIFLPAKDPSGATTAEWDKKIAQIANDVHDRASRGEDMDKLQKEAYLRAGLTVPLPSTDTGSRRRGMMMPSEEQEVFSLSPGGVSKVEHEPSGYVIYKVNGKQTRPVDQVKDEISRDLLRQKMEKAMKSIKDSVHADFNDQYFGPAPPNPPAQATPSPSPTPH